MQWTQRRICALPAIAALVGLCCVTDAVAVSVVDKSQLRRRSRQTTEVVQNEFLMLMVQSDVATGLGSDEGRFQLITTGGDPDVSSDDNLDLMFPTGTTSYTTLRVLTDRAGAMLATPGDFPFNARPVVAANGVVDAEMPVDITATNGVGGGAGQITDLTFRQILTLARHSLEIRYEVKNVSGVVHQVGLRIMIDTQLGVNDGAPFLLPVIGRITNEMEFLKPDIPAEWIATDNFNAPTVLSQGVLTGSEAQTPDRFLFANWQTINPALYDYTINPTRDIVTDSAVAMYWNPEPLAPGATRTYVTYYGLGYASAEFSRPFVLATTSPFSLRYVDRDDINTPETEASLAPNPFTIGGHIFNRSPRQIGGATLSLQLPQGFELEGNDSLVKSVGNVDPLQSGSVEWTVRATGEAAGKVAFSVTGGGTSAPAKSVSREINVPHLPFGFSLPPTTRMISFPFKFADADPAVSLGLTNSEFQLARYDPRLGRYDFYPASLSATQLRPGNGYWIQAAGITPISLRGAEIVTVDDHAVDLEAGWNQIGNPFPVSIYLGSLEVLADNQRMDWDTAINLGYVRGTLFKWNPDRREYEFSYEPDYLMQPLEGFWLRALKDVVLLMPSTQVIGAIRSSSSNAPATADGWRLQLAASGGGLRDSQNYLGASASASDQFRAREDIEEPPPFSPYLSLRFVHDEWGAVGRNFAQDLRSAQGRQVWEVEVSTDLSEEEITLSWPSVTNAPRNLRLTLTDLATGQSVYMRTRASYRFRSDAGQSVRRLRVTATEDALAALRIMNFHALPGRANGAKTFTYTLSEPAEVRLTIRAGGGRVVHQAGAAQTRAAGLNLVDWNGTDRTGRAVPRGIYLAEIVAVAEDGQSAKAVTSVDVR